MNIRIKKSSFRMVVLILVIGIVGYLMLRGGTGEKQENEIAVTAVYCDGADVTVNADLDKIITLVGDAGITKSSKHYNGESVAWRIEFGLNGEAWTMVLGEEINLMFNDGGDSYKVKNSDEIIASLTECVE